MCVICVSDRGIVPPHESLAAMQAKNRDGIGVGWQQDGVVHFRRGITLPEAEVLLAAIAARKAAYILHFRLATVGGLSKRLCHPFPISCDQRLLFAKSGTHDFVLAQNGHFNGWEKEQPLPDKKHRQHTFSDTAAIAYIAASDRKTIIIPNGHKIVTLMGSGNQDANSNVSPCEVHGPLKLWGYWPTRYLKKSDGTDDTAAPFYVSNTYWEPTSSYSYSSSYSSSRNSSSARDDSWPNAAAERVHGVFYDNYGQIVQTPTQLKTIASILRDVFNDDEFDSCSIYAGGAVATRNLRHIACPRSNLYACEHGNYFDCDDCPPTLCGMPLEVLPTTENACKGTHRLNIDRTDSHWREDHLRPTYRLCGIPLDEKEHVCQHTGHHHCSECNKASCVAARKAAAQKFAAKCIGAALAALGKPAVQQKALSYLSGKKCAECGYFNDYHNKSCSHYAGKPAFPAFSGSNNSSVQLPKSSIPRSLHTHRSKAATKSAHLRYGNAPDCLNKANPSWCIAGYPCINCITFRKEQSKRDAASDSQMARNAGSHVYIDGERTCIHSVDLNAPCARCGAGDTGRSSSDAGEGSQLAPMNVAGITRRFLRGFWRQ